MKGEVVPTSSSKNSEGWFMKYTNTEDGKSPWESCYIPSNNLSYPCPGKQKIVHLVNS